ncbi:NnrS family protein, partial [Aeromonas veronii]
TRNWLARVNPGRMPASFGTFDTVSMALAVTSLAAWILAPGSVAVGAGLIVAGLVQAVRLSRWAGDRTWRDPLVLILHVAYAFVPAGFVLV